MQSTTKQIIIEILTITEYQGDKENFANQLIDLFHQKALFDLIESLPEENKEKLKKQLSEHVTPEMGKTLLLQHTTPDKYLEYLKKSTEKIFKDYLKDVFETLNEQKKEEVKNYLLSLNIPH